MKHATRISTFIILVAVLLHAGCKTSATKSPKTEHPPDIKTLQGKISRGRYTAQNGKFSCQVPRIRDGTTYTKDSKGSFGGSVHFSDSGGTFIRITYQGVDKTTHKNLKKSEHHLATLKAFLKSHIQTPTEKQIGESVPVIDDSYWLDKKRPMLFSLLHCPKASPFQEINTGRRPDAFRGILVFYQKPYLYGITLQDKKFAQNDPIPVQQMSRDLKHRLQKFFQTFRF